MTKHLTPVDDVWRDRLHLASSSRGDDLPQLAVALSADDADRLLVTAQRLRRDLWCLEVCLCVSAITCWAAPSSFEIGRAVGVAAVICLVWRCLRAAVQATSDALLRRSQVRQE